jgi:hypothetical protein
VVTFWAHLREPCSYVVVKYRRFRNEGNQFCDVVAGVAQGAQLAAAGQGDRIVEGAVSAFSVISYATAQFSRAFTDNLNGRGARQDKKRREVQIELIVPLMQARVRVGPGAHSCPSRSDI